MTLSLTLYLPDEKSILISCWILVRFILIPKILLVDDLMMKKDVSLMAN